MNLFQGFNETDTFSFEREFACQGHRAIAGVDEAGRGPLAGPVVAACVILPQHCDFHKFKDSKKLSPSVRGKLFQELMESGYSIGIGVVSETEIDRLNILQASLLAMKLAVEDLSTAADYLLVDGKFKVPMQIPQTALVKGDCRSATISAASIIAKVTRDQMMEKYHEIFPQYNFRKHKGYPTLEHRKYIEIHGPCTIHRKTFKCVREYI
ncbi:MAG: ribonuclease HII [Proteobacteria bacterium]|nr:ribonuclease HII [Pseudomonadota bacterium]MBU1710995.1 ribonuclease HII [Pseudomonadota bacterium]